MIGSPIEEIKNRLNIVEVISGYLKLQKAGVNFRALCPFHSEKKPSFFVSPSRQIWHCFGCGKGGSIFNFVMEIEGVEFGDALRILAQKAGVELKREHPKLKSQRQRLYEICQLATRFFEKQLESSRSGQTAKKYLLGRGLTEESIKKWRLGYAPDNWQALSDFLTSQGYQKEEIEKAGLAVKKELSSFYDRFRGRIIFPIFDFSSQIIGFGGRVFKEKDKAEVAKYVNTPNTLLYDKSRVLYGLDKARVEIRKKANCLLVEGYTDVILAHQAGFENVVATSGTALTPFQLKILKRYSENLTTAFDMDVAGDSATKRGIELAQAQGFNIKVILLPKDSDPADIISRDLKKWQDLVKNARSILDFYFENAFSRFDPKNPEGKREISKILLPIIKRIPNKIVQAHWIQKLAKKLEVKEEDIETELKKVKLNNLPLSSPNSEATETRSLSVLKSRRELLEERLATMVLKSPGHLNLINDDNLTCLSPQIQEVLVGLKENKSLNSEYFNYLSLKAEIEEIEEKEILPEINFCLKEIKSLDIKRKLKEISQEIKKAEKEQDSRKIEKLTKDFIQWAQKIQAI